LISQTIARRYAKALLALGQEDGNFTQYGEELAAFTRLLANRELAEALVNPIYPADSRLGVLKAVLAKLKLSKIVENFLGLLFDKGRISHLEAINSNFQLMVDEANNIKRAMVVTAGPLSAAVQARVQETLARMTGKTVILEAKEDPEILGGIVAQVGDLTLDGSVRTQLKNLKESLIKG